MIMITNYNLQHFKQILFKILRYVQNKQPKVGIVQKIE